MVVQCLGLHNVQPGCTPVLDPANPHFFAYGSFPMYLLAIVANGLAHVFAGHPGLPTDGGVFNDYNHITLIGRVLSALFDTGTVVVTGLLARRLAGRWWGVFAAAFVAFTAFEIQLSHFYAVDTVLTFFVTLTLYGAVGLAGFPQLRRLAPGEIPPVRHTLGWALLTGIAFGLALSSKVSAAPLLVPIVLAVILRWRRVGGAGWADALAGLFATGCIAIVTFAVTMPYFFLDSAEFWRDVNEQNALAKGTLVYPYTIQFAGRAPYLDQLKNLFLWDMGFLLALAGVVGALYAVTRVWRRWDDISILLLAWVGIYFGITGGFYTKFSRYQLPIYPALAVLAALMLAAAHGWLQRRHPLAANAAPWQRKLAGASGGVLAGIERIHLRRWLAPALAGMVIASGIGMSLAFLQIYSEPMTRLAASDWIYQHLPPGSVLTHEVWDDALPLQRPGKSPGVYQYTDLNLYDPDTANKATTLAGQIAGANAIILSSARLLGSIPRVPATYPLTTHYYQLLFNGGLGFHLVAKFQNNPHLWFFNLPDTQADESFSVYDHPTVWILCPSRLAPDGDAVAGAADAGRVAAAGGDAAGQPEAAVALAPGHPGGSADAAALADV